ncbi:hypothetical protein VULLAG_LOCUS4042 [Vulpes lagopus]
MRQISQSSVQHDKTGTRHCRNPGGDTFTFALEDFETNYLLENQTKLEAILIIRYYNKNK